MTGQIFGWAVMAVVSFPPKSYRPTVSSSGVSSVGKELSTRASTRPAWPMMLVLALATVRSTVPSGRIIWAASSPSSKGRVRTQRFRYQRASPSARATPWIMPSPKNQWGEVPLFGLGPLR